VYKRLSRRDALQQLHFDEYNSLNRWQKYPIKFEYFEYVGIITIVGIEPEKHIVAPTPSPIETSPLIENSELD
jgi:hypothetical protein